MNHKNIFDIEGYLNFRIADKRVWTCIMALWSVHRPKVTVLLLFAAKYFFSLDGGRK